MLVPSVVGFFRDVARRSLLLPVLNGSYFLRQTAIGHDRKFSRSKWMPGSRRSAEAPRAATVRCRCAIFITGARMVGRRYLWKLNDSRIDARYEICRIIDGSVDLSSSPQVRV